MPLGARQSLFGANSNEAQPSRRAGVAMGQEALVHQRLGAVDWLLRVHDAGSHSHLGGGSAVEYGGDDLGHAHGDVQLQEQFWQSVGL